MTPSRSRRSAFTLVEVMVALTVGSLAVAGTLALLRQVLDITYYDAGRLLLNRDLRKLTQSLESTGVAASFVWVYPTYGQWYASSGYSVYRGGFTMTGDTTSNLNVGANASGDLIIFFFETANPLDGTCAITRVAGFYLDAAPGVSGPLRAFDITLSDPEPVDSAAAPNPIYRWLPGVLNEGIRHTNPVLISSARPPDTGQLFVNLGNRSVMVHAALSESGSLARPKTGVPYTFTVTPRGS